MRLLLDTHLIIWSLCTPDRLSKKVQQYICEMQSVYVSAASIWEMSIKVQLGKLQLDLEKLLKELDNIGIHALPITWQHAQLTQALPLYHKDPFDRLLIAQAISEPVPLLTNDAVLPQYSELVKHIDTL